MNVFFFFFTSFTKAAPINWDDKTVKKFLSVSVAYRWDNDSADYMQLTQLLINEMTDEVTEWFAAFCWHRCLARHTGVEFGEVSFANWKVVFFEYRVMRMIFRNGTSRILKRLGPDVLGLAQATNPVSLTTLHEKRTDGTCVQSYRWPSVAS